MPSPDGATAAARSHQSRRWIHQEAETPSQQFGGSRVDYKHFSPQIEGYAAVFSHDGQGGALLRAIAKMHKFASHTAATPDAAYWDVQQLSEAMETAFTAGAQLRNGSSDLHQW